MSNVVKTDREWIAESKLDTKIEILQRCDNSAEVYQSLSTEIDQWRNEVNRITYEVYDQPYGVAWEVDCHMELLDDLREYTEIVKSDGDIPDHLEYITPFWNKVSN